MSTKQRSGRTYRMIQAAKQLTDMGGRVIIFADNRIQVEQLILRLAEYGDRIDVKSVGSVNFDWETMSCEGSRFKYDHVLVDHFAIERRFGLMIEQLHYFDAEKFVGTKLEGGEDEV